MATDPIVIASAARTPMGAFMGELKSLAAPELGAIAIRAALSRALPAAELIAKLESETAAALRHSASLVSEPARV